MLRPVVSVELNGGMKFNGPGLYIKFMGYRDRYPGFVEIHTRNGSYCVNKNYVLCIIEEGN